MRAASRQAPKLQLPTLASGYNYLELSSRLSPLLTTRITNRASQVIMALIQTSLIWVAYAVAIAILLVIAATFVFIYQDPRERAASVSTVCIITTSALLATILLMPVDIALVASTGSSKDGRKKDWATPDKVDSILRTLEIVYYCLYTVDALLCLIVVPFTYFWFEEYDPDGEEDGSQTLGSRLWGAFKYTIFFILFVVIIFLLGFFIPAASRVGKGGHMDLDYFKKLLTENRKIMFFEVIRAHKANILQAENVHLHSVLVCS